MFSLRNKKIIFELSPIPPLIWNSDNRIMTSYIQEYLSLMEYSADLQTHVRSEIKPICSFKCTEK